MFYREFFIVLLLSLSSHAVNMSYADQRSLERDFASIEEVSQTLLSLCPKDRCVIVGIGRSPTPFLAYLETMTEHYVYNIPLTAFRYGISQDPLDAEHREKLYRHFSTFLPDALSLNGPSIMLLDFASTQGGGESALATARYLETYLGIYFRENPPQVKIAIVKANHKMEQVPYRINYIFRFEKEALLIHSLSDNIYKKYAPYGEFNIMNDEHIRSRRQQPGFLELKRKLQEIKERRGGGFEYDSFKLIEQAGTLDFNWQDHKHFGVSHWLGWYVLQLKYYRGPDQTHRFNEVYEDQQGRQLLINNWDRFTLLPDAQAKILSHISPQKTPHLMDRLVTFFRSVAPSLQATVVETLLMEADDRLTNMMEEVIPGRTADLFLSIYFHLRALPQFQQSANKMLNHFLMPEVAITDEGIEPWVELIKEWFTALIEYDAPNALSLAKQKYEEYRSQKTWLPKIYRYVSSVKIPVVGQDYDNVRNQLLQAAYEAIIDSERELMDQQDQ